MSQNRDERIFRSITTSMRHSKNNAFTTEKKNKMKETTNARLLPRKKKSLTKAFETKFHVRPIGGSIFQFETQIQIKLLNFELEKSIEI